MHRWWLGLLPPLAFSRDAWGAGAFCLGFELLAVASWQVGLCHAGFKGAGLEGLGLYAGLVLMESGLGALVGVSFCLGFQHP